MDITSLQFARVSIVADWPEITSSWMNSDEVLSNHPIAGDKTDLMVIKIWFGRPLQPFVGKNLKIQKIDDAVPANGGNIIQRCCLQPVLGKNLEIEHVDAAAAVVIRS